VLLHTGGTNQWLRVVGSPLDLRSQAVALAQQAARDRDAPIAMGIATVGSVGVMLTAGAFDLAQAALDLVTVPTTTSDGLQLDGMLALSRSLVAAADGDHERAVATAEGLRPGAHPNLSRRAAYWVDYGRALARVRGRHDEAVMALGRAETISPLHLHRSLFAREALAGLLTRTRPRLPVWAAAAEDGLPGGPADVAIRG
jgi:hypothetical protein